MKCLKQIALSLGVIGLSASLLSGCEESGASVNPQPFKTPSHYLSKDGVGPINSDTPFNLHLIGEAFQGYNVAEETSFVEGDQYPVITIKDREKPLLTINPDHARHKVFSVMVYDNFIGNRLEHKIGTKFADIYPYEKVEQCAAGMEELAGKVLCRAPSSGNILYLFEGKWSGPSDTVPPLPLLAEWKLASFIWKPPLQTASVEPAPANQ